VETHDPEIFRRRCVNFTPSSVEGARPHPAPPLQNRCVLRARREAGWESMVGTVRMVVAPLFPSKSGEQSDLDGNRGVFDAYGADNYSFHTESDVWTRIWHNDSTNWHIVAPCGAIPHEPHQDCHESGSHWFPRCRRDAFRYY